MSLAGDIRRSLIRLGYPVVSAYYRAHKGNCPVSVLKFLGVAHPSYRRYFYTLDRITRSVASIGGLIAECGVYRGETLLGIAHLLREICGPGFRLIGFDSFEGFPEPDWQDALPDGSFHRRALKGVFSDTSDRELRRRIHALGFEDQITLAKGYFENTLPAWKDKTFALVHLDCDLYQSYITCLNFFYPRVRPGGYIVFDEYDFIADVYPGAQKAIDSFLADKPEKIQVFEESSRPPYQPRYFIIKQ